MSKYAAGQVWRKATPFLVEDRLVCDTFGQRTVRSWRPGIRWLQVAPDDSEPDSDGEGIEVRTIAAFVEIAGEVPRILYRRHLVDPTGKVFGKPKMRMTTPSAFSAWINDSAGCRNYDSRCKAEMAT